MHRLGLLSLLVLVGCSRSAALSPAEQVTPSEVISSSAQVTVPHVVLQPRGPGNERVIVTPGRTWRVTDHNGLSLIDARSGAAIATLPTWDLVQDVAVSPDGRDVFLVVRDRRQVHDGIVAKGLWDMRTTLERWDVATGRRRWSRVLAKSGGDARDHIGVSDSRVVLTRCDLGGAATCSAFTVAVDTGELRKRASFPLKHSTTFWRRRAESARGRFVLRGTETRGFVPDSDPQVILTPTGWKPYKKPPTLPLWTLFDSGGLIVGTVHAGCARFDRDDVLWLAYTDPSDIPALRALGLDVREGAAACLPAFPAFPPLPYDSTQEGVDDMASMTATNTHVVWAPLAASTRRVYAFDIERVGLPAVVELPPAGNDPWWVSSTRGELVVVDDTRVLSFTAVGAAPLEERLPREALVWRDGDVSLAAWLIDSYTSALALKQGRGRWRTLDVRASPRFPAFGITHIDGLKTAVIATGKHGLAWVDVSTGRVVKRRTDNATGLALDPDLNTVWTIHEQRATPRTQAFQQIDLVTGKVLRSIPAPDLVHASDQLSWGIRGELLVLMAECVTTVSVKTSEVAQHCLGGRSMTTAPRGRFIATWRPVDTVEIRSLGGESVLTTAIRGADSLALTADGRFACTGEACGDLKCIVGDDARPVTDAACAALRSEGFSVIDELSAMDRDPNQSHH